MSFYRIGSQYTECSNYKTVTESYCAIILLTRPSNPESNKSKSADKSIKSYFVTRKK